MSRRDNLEEESEGEEEVYTLPKLHSLPQEIKRERIPFHLKNVEFVNVETREKWFKRHKGPSDTSNWIIQSDDQGSLLMSAYPMVNPSIFSRYGEEKSEKYGRKLLENLVKKGKIRVFVCLQEEHELNKTRRGGEKRFLEYKDLAKKFCENEERNEELEFETFSVPDVGVPRSIEHARNCVQYIFSQMKLKKKVLLHCYGGHGRTGTIMSCFLAEYYEKLSLEDIFRYVQACHDCRKVVSSSGFPYFCPENRKQREFVRQYFQDVQARRND